MSNDRVGREVDVWIADLDHLGDVGEDALSAHERARTARFRLDVDRKRYATGRALLRRLLADQLDVSPGSLRFAVGPYGKPQLEHPAAPLEFNVTHGGHLVLVALSSTLPVGIDVERIDPSIDWSPLARQFFAPNEHRAINLLAREDRRTGFFACWTRKEAVVKAIGAGLSYPLDEFEVTVHPDAAPELLSGGAAIKPRDWALQDIPAGVGFRACVAAPGPICVRSHTVR